MSNFLEKLINNMNLTNTENGALTRKTTNSALMDLFALGGAYRNRSAQECMKLFKDAFNEDEKYALKCLFYLRDCREGQGERRFFKVCLRWLANNRPEAVMRNINYIAEFGRWDDIFTLFDTALEDEALSVIKTQLMLDIVSNTPSLLGKWLPSINASSRESKRLGMKIESYLGMTHKEYRKMLAVLRSKINLLEKLMSENRWDEIKFDKIPSKAGFIYRNAFARRDVIKEKYKAFAEDKDTKVNASVLYPYECVKEVLKWNYYYDDDIGAYKFHIDETAQREMVNKYWDNLKDYINGANFNGIAVVDTSGSMYELPITVAISLGLYCAEKNNGPYANKFITFSDHPELINVKGEDFCAKVANMSDANWGYNTDIEKVFKLLLDTAISANCSQEEIPENLIIISDMEFDSAISCYPYRNSYITLLEGIEKEWNDAGYKMPKLVFWNVDARQNNIPMLERDGISFVSGFSPVLYEQIMKGLTAKELMFDKLNSDRYACIE